MVAGSGRRAHPGQADREGDRPEAGGQAGRPRRGGRGDDPLDTIVSLRTDRSAGLAGWFVTESLVVTTADGTEHEFRGRTGYVQAGLASALAELGREVRATPLGLTVTPRTLGHGA